jgi:two-component system, NarL family, sensor kinase
MDLISQEVILVVISTSFFLLLAVGIVILILIYQKKQLQLIVQKKELETKVERELMAVQLETREHTLNLVALEIHDNVGQALSLAKLNLNRLAEITPNTPVMHSTKELVSKAIQDLRTLSKTLNSNYIFKTNLAECLAFDLSMVHQGGAMETKLETEGTETGLSDQTKLIVYRMAQEILNNTVRHSEATRVLVKVAFTDTTLLLEIEDNGKGLQQQPDLAPNGTGLSNLFVRAKMIDGEFSLTNGLTGGVTARLIVPLKFEGKR